jgi:hypothetical protein
MVMCLTSSPLGSIAASTGRRAARSAASRVLRAEW